MKKRLVIGDLHGRYDYLKDAYSYENPDEVILLGDYFDSQSIQPKQQVESWKSILKLRKKHIAKNCGYWIMLLGNHDAQYLPKWPVRSSEWNKDTENLVKSRLKRELGKGTLRVAWIDTDIKTIYSHAGISQTWYNSWLSESLGNIETVTLDAFQFVGEDPYGDDPRNSPLWIRPASLITDSYQDKSGHIWDQVFGHTESMSPLAWSKLGDDGTLGEFWCVDCLPKAYLRETIDGTRVTRELIDSISHEELSEVSEDLSLSILSGGD
jgi:hypothetical protein